MLRIAIDLTPMLPGGANGGAKIMTLQLIKHLAALAPNNLFILLASKKNKAELSLIKAPNVTTFYITSPHINISNFFVFLLGAFLCPIVLVAKKILRGRLKAKLGNIYHRVRYYLLAKDIARLVKPDILFCPFTAPFFYHLNIPIVSVIYDLQSHYYPFFFTPEECYEREKNFNDTCLRSSKLICISDFVKKTIVQNNKFNPDNIHTIHIRLAHRLPVAKKRIETPFLLFPANFWAHKNHAILFTALGIYRAKYPQSNLKLICTGANNTYQVFLLHAIQKMNLSDWIVMPGYLSDEEFASLLTSCSALIFPSLYEGFGMPVLEAMAAGKPVLCSNTTNLPEIAGTAALLFDPRKPDEIAHAIERIMHEPTLAESLITKGYQQVASFGTEMDMAKEYLHLFEGLKF